jgi:hypothetical protein
LVLCQNAGDDEIDEIRMLVAVGTPVEIRP